ncbi:hypothetical protein PLICRDRAFT_96444 [Plicaturopsis crispa FD-325 SS-3]|nr:hypothetical protein PLICRDRAFT_96444 [Plicaturopsis crispa FD-325 SS-3]
MSFLVSLLKPLAYISLPVFLLRFAASTSPYASYLYRLGLYTGTMALVGTFGFISSLGMSIVGQRYNVNWVVARTFYAAASTVLGLTIEVEGEEHLLTRPAVFIGNHQSMLDILILGRIFPKQASIMAKKELQWSPALGPFMTMSGTVFIDRGNSAKAQRSLEAAGEGMKARGTSLYMYPEGTRHSGEEPSLLPFKKGAFHLAVQAGLPIVPIVTENYWRIYHKGVFGSGVLKVKVLPPISTTGLTSSDVSELSVRVREQMLDTLRDISVKVPSPSSPKRGESPALTPAPPAASADRSTPAPPSSTPDAHKTESEASSSDASAGKRIEGSENGADTEDEGSFIYVGHPA